MGRDGIPVFPFQKFVSKYTLGAGENLCSVSCKRTFKIP